MSLTASLPGSAEGAGLFLDYSKNRITDETMRLLLRLAEERGVARRRDAMFAVYAYCRVIDDIADSDDPPATKLAGLAVGRDEVEAILGQVSSGRVSRVYPESTNVAATVN